MATSLYLRVHPWCRSKYHDHVVFTKSIFFILGLILSYKLVEKTFLDILITRLNDAWEVYDLRRAVIIVNLQEGATAVLVTLFAYAADVHTGRFRMLVFSCAICIIGLLLNYAAAGNGDRLNFGLFYPALVLLTLAQAAQTVTLQPFFEDQLRPKDPTSAGAGDGGDTAWERHSRFWWKLVSVVAAIFALFGPIARFELRDLATTLTVLMAVSFVVFLSGIKKYNFVATIENPFKHVVTVVLGAIAQRKVEYAQTSRELFGNSDGDDVHISPRAPWLRWLDRAAVVQEIQPFRGNPSSAEEVRRVKLLLNMLPLWSCFLSLSLVDAFGSTFFFEEAFSIAPNYIGPILFFSTLQRFTESMVSELCSYILRKLGKRKMYNQQRLELVRIGIGLTCCVPCCIAAWVASGARRQHKNDGNAMSVYFLTPQFLLLGIMGGLSEKALQSFYESQVSETLYRFGPPFAEFVMGVGKFTCAVCVLIFSPIGWSRRELDDSRLDKYYVLLAVLSFVNVVLFCLISCWYGDDVFLVGDDEETGTADQADVQLLVDGIASRSTDISHRSHYLRAASEPKRINSFGDTVGEMPLLPSASTDNGWRSKSLS